MNFAFGECDENEVEVILMCVVHRDNEDLLKKRSAHKQSKAYAMLAQKDTHTCTHMHTHMHAHTHTHMYTHTHTQTHTHIHTHTHTHIHTYIHAYIHTLLLSLKIEMTF